MAYKVSVAVTLCDSDWKKCSLIIPCKYIFYLLSNYQHSFSKKKHAVIVGYIRASFWRHCRHFCDTIREPVKNVLAEFVR